MLKTASIRHEIELDEFVIMPNHFYAIITIVKCENDLVGATHWVAPTKTGLHAENEMRGGKTTIVSNSIGSMVGQFKSITTKRVNAIRGTRSAPIWQRNYWDHIIRDGNELSRIREYIHNNPMQWNMDVEDEGHPAGN